MSRVLEIIKNDDAESVVETVYSEADVELYNPFTSDDVIKLPFEDGEFDGVFAYFVLNAYSWRHSMLAMKEWVRVVKMDGVVHVLVPSQRWLGALMQQSKLPPVLRPLLFGDQSGYAGDTYRSCYNMGDLRMHMQACGLGVVQARVGRFELELGGEIYEAEQLYVAGQKNEYMQK
jgi:SAM-dependent methyltransferase